MAVPGSAHKYGGIFSFRPKSCIKPPVRGTAHREFKRMTFSLRHILGICLLAAALTLRAEQIDAEPVDLTKTQPAAADPKIAALIAQLGAADTVLREDAEKTLTGMGKAAMPLLKEAENSPNPEIVVRARRIGARIADAGVKPASYAAVLPADSIFFFEISDCAATLDHLKFTPVGQLWEKPSMKAFNTGKRDSMLEKEIKVYDALTALPKLAAGKFVVALSSPDTIEPAEIDAPLLYILETKNLQAVEAQTRNLFESMNDGAKTKRQYKKFQIEEQNNACTVFSGERVIHALTAKGMEGLLDKLIAPPAQPLTALLTDLRTQRPKADVCIRLAADGLKNLAEANQFLDDELYAIVDTAGLQEGGFIEDAVTLNTQGVEELVRIQSGGIKNKGLLAVLQRMTIKPAPPAQANQPQALDMIPYQAAFVASFSGDASKHAAELSSALAALDALGGQPQHNDINPNLLPAKPVNPANPNDPVAPPRPPGPPKSRAEQALLEGGGDVLDEKKVPKRAEKDPANPAEPQKKKAKEPERSTPHIARLLQAGFTMEEFLAQADGPTVLALFPERVDISKVLNPHDVNNPPDPDHVPMAALFAMYLKDPAPIVTALDKANKGIQPRYIKQVLNGGTFYAEDNEDNSPGFWISGKYLAYGTSKDIVDLAGAAVLNQAGNNRMAARKAYVDYLATSYDPQALLNIFGDSKQFLEMPYKMAQLQWDDNQRNPWPDFAVVAGLLKGNSIHIKVKQVQGGLQIESQTPISILGLIVSIFKPLKEAVLIN